MKKQLAGVLVGAMALALTAAGCSNAQDEPDGDTAASSSSTSVEGAFPASVDGAYGTVVVPEQPERIVAMTAQVAEILHELGTEPVAVAASPDDVEANSPWLSGLFDDVLDPDLKSEAGEVDLEAVAGHDPDLVIGPTWLLNGEVNEQLSAFTVVYPGVDEGIVPWQDTAEAIAALTGTDAQPLLTRVDDVCEQARAQVPDVVGGTYQYGITYDSGYFFGNGEELSCFGLVPAANQDNTQTANASVSQENLDQLDADVLVMWDLDGTLETMAADPRFDGLPANTTGAAVVADDQLGAAINLPGPLAFDYLIERLLPELAAAQASS